MIGLIPPGMGEQIGLVEDDMAVCPICDNGIYNSEFVVIKFLSMYSLAHEYCYQNLIDQFEGKQHGKKT